MWFLGIFAGTPKEEGHKQEPYYSDYSHTSRDSGMGGGFPLMGVARISLDLSDPKQLGIPKIFEVYLNQINQLVSSTSDLKEKVRSWNC